jgi:hypothetical protein
MQQVGSQVAGGGFGDIWKGLVRGQSVSIKIMRILTALKVSSTFSDFPTSGMLT